MVVTRSFMSLVACALLTILVVRRWLGGTRGRRRYDCPTSGHATELSSLKSALCSLRLLRPARSNGHSHRRDRCKNLFTQR